VTGITEHLAVLQGRVAAAARAAGRDPATITLLAASKGQPAALVAAAAAAGVTHFGENYVQEGAAKAAALGPARQDLAWHFIGRLQSNKTAQVADAFDWVQTVTDARLASRLASQRRFHGPPLNVCIQVAPEGPGAGARVGCAGAGVPALADHIAALPRLALRGLMLLPLPGLAVDELRAEFRRLAGLLAALRTAGHDVDTLSCGMSGDFELAIAEGSTMVRIGTALFGPRPEAHL
jgi:pyridoxal phosphate enzyme (YggS family)